MQLLKRILDIAKKSSKEILKYYKVDHKFEYKNDQNPFKLAYRISHDIIIKGLKHHFYDIPIISE